MRGLVRRRAATHDPFWTETRLERHKHTYSQILQFGHVAERVGVDVTQVLWLGYGSKTNTFVRALISINGSQLQGVTTNEILPVTLTSQWARGDQRRPKLRYSPRPRSLRWNWGETWINKGGTWHRKWLPSHSFSHYLTYFVSFVSAHLFGWRFVFSSCARAKTKHSSASGGSPTTSYSHICELREAGEGEGADDPQRVVLRYDAKVRGGTETLVSRLWEGHCEGKRNVKEERQAQASHKHVYRGIKRRRRTCTSAFHRLPIWINKGPQRQKDDPDRYNRSAIKAKL